MSRATRVRNVGTFEDVGSAKAALIETGDVAVVVRGRPRWLLMRCPDGCGEDISVNLDQRAGKAWRLHDRGTLSVFPSIWRESGCESHFVIWRNGIWWGYDWELESDSPELETQLIGLLAQVGRPMDVLAISTQLDAESWTVLLVCNKLLREKRINREGMPGAYVFSFDAEGHSKSGV